MRCRRRRPVRATDVGNVRLFENNFAVPVIFRNFADYYSGRCTQRRHTWAASHVLPPRVAAAPAMGILQWCGQGIAITVSRHCDRAAEALRLHGQGTAITLPKHCDCGTQCMKGDYGVLVNGSFRAVTVSRTMPRLLCPIRMKHKQYAIYDY